jgi:hypothetical protein
MKRYDKIVNILKEIGTKATLDGIKILITDVRDGILMLDPISGWLAIRKKHIIENKLENTVKTIPWNYLLYKDKDNCRCLGPELKEILNQIRR